MVYKKLSFMLCSFDISTDHNYTAALSICYNRGLHALETAKPQSRHQHPRCFHSINDYFYHTYKEKGYTSIRELEGVQLDELDLNPGEKKRMKLLFEFVQTKFDGYSGTNN